MKFDLKYVDAESKEQTPVVIHRAILGSLDRFMAYIIEETKGKFPVWLAPLQVKVLPVSEKNNEYATKVYNLLADADVRAVLDDRNEKVGYKIREAQQVDRAPYMLILGAKEEEEGTVSVRSRDTGETVSMPLEAFVEKVTSEIKSRTR
jgi:threonyl-tRNA synthetase